ncbi:MAG: peptide deformylase, partial [Saprospiraceae bacterium]|nr:peptide deformylase [Saprospiraceae bacterium]
TIQMMDEGKEEEGFKAVFINPEKVQEGGNPWAYEEGCLSIPDIHGDVERPAQIKLKYFDTDWQPQEKVFNGIHARVIQHEYDHIEGILFVEHLKPLKKRRIKRGLESIRKGEIESKYKMRFARG